MADVAKRRIFVALMTVLAMSVATAAWAFPSGTPQDTVDPNDRVYAIVQVGRTIYIGGEFTAVDGQPRNHLAAIDASTGALTAWNPDANGSVRPFPAGREQQLRGMLAGHPGTPRFPGSRMWVFEHRKLGAVKPVREVGNVPKQIPNVLAAQPRSVRYCLNA